MGVLGAAGRQKDSRTDVQSAPLLGEGCTYNPILMAKWQGMDQRVRLVSIAHGADFEIELTELTDPTPTFAYVDDDNSRVEVLQNLSIDGTITIEDRPDFMWLQGARKCVRLRATGGKTASFRSLTVGEFCVEIYYVRLDGSAELIHQNDFCFK